MHTKALSINRAITVLTNTGSHPKTKFLCLAEESAGSHFFSFRFSFSVFAALPELATILSSVISISFGISNFEIRMLPL